MSDTEDNLPKPEGSGEDYRNEADNDHSQNGDRHEDRMEEEGDKEENNRDRDEADRSDGGENNERKEREPRGERVVSDELRRKRVFVGNLSFQTSWQKLKDFMRKIGKVERVDIFENRSGESKGFGLVQFQTEEEAQTAIREMNQTNLDGRLIFVRKDDPNSKDAFPKEKRQDRRSPPRRRTSPRRRSYSRSRSRSHDRDRRRRDDRSGRRSSRSRSPDRRDYRRDKDDYGSRRRDRSRDRRDSRSRDRRSRSKERDRRDRDDRRDRGDRGDRGDRKSGRGDGVQVIVKNMPYSVTWQQLKDAFREYGKVLRAEVPQDEKGRSKGYGYVKFETERDASKAIDGMHGAAFNDRKIQVEMCNNNNTN